MLPVCILCGRTRENHDLAPNHIFAPPGYRNATPIRIETTPPKESTVDNVTSLPWRIKVAGSTVAAVASLDEAAAIAVKLSNGELSALTISFTTEKV